MNLMQTMCYWFSVSEVQIYYDCCQAGRLRKQKKTSKREFKRQHTESEVHKYTSGHHFLLYYDTNFQIYMITVTVLSIHGILQLEHIHNKRNKTPDHFTHIENILHRHSNT